MVEDKYNVFRSGSMFVGGLKIVELQGRESVTFTVIFYKVQLADSQAATVRQLQEGKVQSEII